MVQSFHASKGPQKSNNDKVYNYFLCENKFSSLIPSKSKEVSKLITIQEGCDKFVILCSSHTRGAEFSRTVENIYAETIALVKMVERTYTSWAKRKFIRVNIIKGGMKKN